MNWAGLSVALVAVVLALKVPWLAAGLGVLAAVMWCAGKKD